MIAETSTWRAGDGWSSSLPVPPAPPSGPGSGDALLLVMGDGAMRASAAAAGLDPLGELCDVWRGRAMIGFSTAGQAVGDRLVDGALVATVLRFEHTRVRTASASSTGVGSARRAGREIANVLAADDLCLVFFAAGMSLNGSAVAAGITDVLPGVDMIGVLAADGDRYEQSWTLSEEGLRDDAVTAVGFHGSALEVERATGAGWHPLGLERLVTASHGNVIRELDGETPVSRYRNSLGPLADVPGEFVANCSMLPLEIRDLDGRRSMRSVRSVHPDGSITVSGDVPQGATARLLHACPGDLLHDATVTAKAVRHEDAAFCLVTSTAGRRRVLGQRTEDEVHAVVCELPVGVPVVAGWGSGAVLGTSDVTDLIDVIDAAIFVTSWRERTLGLPTGTTDTDTDTVDTAEHPATDPRAEEG